MLDPTNVPSPCFVLEETCFLRNLRVISDIQQRSGARFILALKGFAMPATFHWMRETICGTAASSLNEVMLGAQVFGGQVHACAPVYRQDEWEAIRAACQHVTFNSLGQFERYRHRTKGVSCGLRINPEYSEVTTSLYNPCAPGSRLGVRADALPEGLPAEIEGLHSHNLCECDSHALERTLAKIEESFAPYLANLRWLNLGGGHLVTRKGYDVDHLVALLCAIKTRYPHIDVILEPGAAFAWETGVLVATVEDVVSNCGISTAMLDTSFAAHMPDCLEMPYTPRIRGALPTDDAPYTYRMGGCSCLAGDYVGHYGFDHPLAVGDRIVFEDMMHYTMVKTNTFNGIGLPSIGIWHADDSFESVATFGYPDYRKRLG